MKLLTLLVLAAGLLASASGPKLIVHGHRGARGTRPENTIPAFRYAIENGVDVLELDVAITKDNVPVVSHDPVINRKICQGPAGNRVIRELTLAEVRRFDCGSLKNPDFPKQEPAPGTQIPTLDEVLDLAWMGEFGYNIEIKSNPAKPELSPPPSEFAAIVVKAIRKHKLARRVIIQSFDFRALHEVHKIAPEIRLSALFSRSGKDFVSIAREAGAGIVSPNYHLVTKAKIAAAHAAGLEVVPWTPNTPETWEKLIADGADAIITDYPVALLRYLKQQGLR